MVLFHARGVTVKEVDGKYYVGMEDGGHMTRYQEIEISKEDAEKVMEDVMYGVKLMNDYDNKLWGLT